MEDLLPSGGHPMRLPWGLTWTQVITGMAATLTLVGIVTQVRERAFRARAR